MEQEIIWILKSLLLPPGGLLLLGLIGLFLSGRLLGRLLLLVTLSSLYLLSTPFISHQLMAGLETIGALTEAQLSSPPAQAIVVLGGGRHTAAPEYLNRDTLSRWSLERIRYAAWLAKKSGLPVIPSGGNPLSDGPPEAQLARQILQQEFGVKVIASEELSRTTAEHAVLLQPILERLEIRRVILVTHAWHMLRALDVFSRAGIDTLAAPMGFEHTQTRGDIHDWLPSSQGLVSSQLALHEYLGRIWYRIRSKINL